MKTKYNNADYNEKGVTLDIGMPASGEAESITKATVSEGTIEIRDKENQKQALAGLNRDTNNSLNKLGEIFYKTKMEERQELANLFGELAYNEIHKLAKKNGWEDGDPEKDALHALIRGYSGSFSGSMIGAGTLSISSDGTLTNYGAGVSIENVGGVGISFNGGKYIGNIKDYR